VLWNCLLILIVLATLTVCQIGNPNTQVYGFGDGANVVNSAIPNLIQTQSPFVQIATASSSMVGVTIDGNVWSWGSNIVRLKNI
jgi:alpha-tubulin suppressor-like RCC1 family protein